MAPAPIILFAYNRPEHLLRTLESLRKCRLSGESEIFIFSDGPKSAAEGRKISEVRRIAGQAEGFKAVSTAESPVNKGLSKSVIEGVSSVIATRGRAIVLEDDLEFSSGFLEYVNAALDFYEKEKKIFSISGYSLPVEMPENFKDSLYFIPRCSSWGWATWQDRWEKADWSVADFKEFIKDKPARDKFDSGGSDLTDMLEKQMTGKIDSWAIRWNYAHYKNNALSVIPVKSKVRNTGCDGSGTHIPSTNRYFSQLDDSEKTVVFPVDINENQQISDNIRAFYNKSIRRRIKRFLRNIAG